MNTASLAETRFCESGCESDGTRCMVRLNNRLSRFCVSHRVVPLPVLCAVCTSGSVPRGYAVCVDCAEGDGMFTMTIRSDPEHREPMLYFIHKITGRADTLRLSYAATAVMSVFSSQDHWVYNTDRAQATRIVEMYNEAYNPVPRWSLPMRSVIEALRNVFAILRRAQTAPTRPAVFPSDIEVKRECPVCLGGDDLLVLGCRHTICEGCLDRVSATCSICRIVVDMALVKRVLPEVV